MEKPRMDGDLHLLTLMHQQLEEAQALGNREPRLEVLEDASGLAIRVAGTEAVEEIRYGGLYHEDELVEDAGEPLRRLSHEGYVELDHGDAGLHAGAVPITEKGRVRIRYRRAFESNLPRLLKRWEISLLGLREIKHMRLWKASWGDHRQEPAHLPGQTPRAHNRIPERGPPFPSRLQGG